MVATAEGPLPYFHEAFTQLHLGQLLALPKCFGMDRRDGGIDPNTDHIPWDSSSSLPRVDEDLGISRVATYFGGRHGGRVKAQAFAPLSRGGKRKQFRMTE